VLGVAVDGLVLAQHPVDHAGRLFVVHLALLTEVDASDPLVLDLFEGWLYLEDSGKFVEEVPECLVLAIDVAVFGGLADEPQQLYLAVSLLKFEPLFALSVDLVLLLLRLGVWFLRGHKYNLFEYWNSQSPFKHPTHQHPHLPAINIHADQPENRTHSNPSFRPNGLSV
jgi:hypothetical protein